VTREPGNWLQIVVGVIFADGVGFVYDSAARTNMAIVLEEVVLRWTASDVNAAAGCGIVGAGGGRPPDIVFEAYNVICAHGAITGK